MTQYFITDTQLEDILRQQREICAEDAESDDWFTIKRESILSAPSPSLPETEEVTVWEAEYEELPEDDDSYNVWCEIDIGGYPLPLVPDTSRFKDGKWLINKEYEEGKKGGAGVKVHCWLRPIKVLRVKDVKNVEG